MIETILKSQHSETFTFFAKNGHFFKTDDLNNELEFKTDSNLKRRLQFYFSWCLKNDSDYSFELILYPDAGEKDLVVRRGYIEILDKNFFKISFKPTIDIRDSIIGNSFSLMDNLKDAVLISESDPIDEPGPRIIYCNKAFSEDTGYMQSEVISKNPRILQGDDTTDEAKANIRSGLEKWDNVRQVIKNYTKDGNPFTVELNISPVKDITGWWTHWISIQRNITKERLEKMSQERVEQIAKIGQWSFHINSDDLLWSDELYKIHGITKDTPLKKDDALSFYPKAERERLNDLINRCITEQKPFDSVFEFYNVKGIKKWVRNYGEALVDSTGKVAEVFGTLQDVTDLVSLQNETRSILEATKIGLWRWELEENNLIWDDSMYSLFEVDKNDFSGTYDAWESTLDPSYKDKAVQELNDAIAGKKDFDTVFKINTKNGGFKYIEARANIERDQFGKALIVNGINIDKTDEYLFKQEIEKQRKVSISQARLASIGELAAGVGHEVNNPLSIAIGNLEVLKAKNPDLDDVYIEKINSAHLRIKQIIDGLRTFARHEKEQISFNIFDLVKESLLFVKEIYSVMGIDIYITDSSINDINVFGNRGELQQVLMNLISNAKDAVLESNKKIIKISVENSKKDNVAVIIEDTGAGISDSIKPFIFDNFYTTKKAGEGTGIGLSLSKSIVEAHLGSINFESSDKGTRFKIEIPISTESNSEKSLENHEEIKSHSDVSILVAEDEEGIRDYLEFIFDDLGYTYQICESGLEAYDVYKKDPSKFKIILSDIQMPKFSGIDFLKKIRADKEIEQPKFIFLTGGVNINLEDTTSDLAEMFDGYLYKPFKAHDISKVVNECLGDEDE